MAELRHIAGLEALKNALKELPDRVARNSLRSSVSAAAALIRDEARILAPQKTGEMVRDIMIKRSRDERGLMVARYEVFVRTGKKSRLSGRARNVDKDSFYWRFVEFGHYTRAKTGEKLRHNGKWQKNYQQTVEWIPARPFMRPAFEAKKEEALQIIQDKLAERIKIEAAALKK